VDIATLQYPLKGDKMEYEYLDSCNLCNSKQIETVDAKCNICKCKTCGYIFDNPRPTFKSIVDFYSNQTKYDSWLSEEQVRDSLWKRRLKIMEKTKKKGTLLDIGTGVGQFLYHAKNYYNKVYGTEISESAIAIAKNKYNIGIIQGEIENIQFSETTFDNITLFHVLEHVPKPKAVIEKCWSLLCPDGVLVIAVPNDTINNKTEFFIDLFRDNKSNKIRKLSLPKITLDGKLAEIHLSHFAPDVLKKLLERSGFIVIANSLDPYYAMKGYSLFRYHLYYLCCLLLMFVFKKNYYGTIYMVAKKGDKHKNA